MGKLNCEVVRDLLPLYEDGVASEKTQELVREHLKDCPACREELRKLRVPVSLPPDDDEGAVKRFLEYRAEVRRKQNVKIIRVASVLAVLLTAVLAFCLWYTRPRSWRDIADAQEGAEIASLAASTNEFRFRSAVDYGFDSWIMDADQAEGPAIQAVTQVLDSHTYRASLRNLFPFPTNGVIEGPTDSAYLSIVLSDTQWTAPSVYSNGWVYFSGNRYYTDDGLYQKLAQIVKNTEPIKRTKCIKSP